MASPTTPEPGAPAVAVQRTQEDARLAALIDETLAGGFPLLRFPRSLESVFIRETGPNRLKTLLIAATLVAFLINAFLLADRAMLPDVFERTVQMRSWFFTPLCLVGVWVLSRLPFLLLRELMAAGAGLLACAIHVYLGSISNSEHAAAYMTGLAVVLLYSNIFVRTRFWLAVPFTVLVLMSYGVSLITVKGQTPALAIPVGLVIVSTALFTLYYLYEMEHEERHNHLLSLKQRLLQRELARANEQLGHLSRHDALTQVANRRHFDEFLGNLWQRARGEPDHSVAILILDVDHFKAYNDRYGHPEGDACLAQVAGALRASLRRPGDLVARYGGEEFVAVLRRMPLEQAVSAGERVRAAVQALQLAHEGSPAGQVTVSVGVAAMVAAERDASPQRLVHLADQALYQAKNHGRNRVWPSLTTSIAEKGV